MDYVNETDMSLIGVSHSASEYLVKETLMYEWFKDILKWMLLWFHRKNGGYSI